MREFLRRRLDEVRSQLTSELDIEHGLLNVLLSKEVINADHLDKIRVSNLIEHALSLWFWLLAQPYESATDEAGFFSREFQLGGRKWKSCWTFWRWETTMPTTISEAPSETSSRIWWTVIWCLNLSVNPQNKNNYSWDQAAATTARWMICTMFSISP